MSSRALLCQRDKINAQKESMVLQRIVYCRVWRRLWPRILLRRCITIKKQHECGHPSFYCPTGSFAPTPVKQGYYSTNGEPHARANQSICEPGRYCEGGIKRLCPAGKFGATHGLASNECSGNGFSWPLLPNKLTSGMYSASNFMVTCTFISNTVYTISIALKFKRYASAMPSWQIWRRTWPAHSIL